MLVLGKPYFWVVLLVLGASLVSNLSAQGSTSNAGERSVQIRSDIPVFMFGKRLEPIDGVHTLCISRSEGFRIDGVVYLKNRISSSSRERARLEDGFFHYVLDRANWIAIDGYGEEKEFNQIRDEVLAFWQQYEDRLTVDIRSENDFMLTYEGNSVGYSIPRNYNIDAQQCPDYYERLILPRFEMFKRQIERGCMVICGDVYFNSIEPNDVENVLLELAQLKSIVKTAKVIDGKPIYNAHSLVGGKYTLISPAISDFVTNR